MSELVAEADPEIDADLRAALDRTLIALGAIKTAAEAGTAYDQMLATGNAAGEALVMGAIDALIAQTRSIERAVSALGARGDRLRGLGQPRQPGGGVPVGDAPLRARPRCCCRRRRWRRRLAACRARAEEAARIAAVTAPTDRLLDARAVRGAAGRCGDRRQGARRQRLLALLGQHELRARARLQGRQRPLPQALGDGAGLDRGSRTGSGRSTTPAPASPATSRTAAPTRRPGRDDPAVGMFLRLSVPAEPGEMRAGDRRDPGLSRHPARPDLRRAAAELRASPASRPRGGWRSTTSRSR